MKSFLRKLVPEPLLLYRRKKFYDKWLKGLSDFDRERHRKYAYDLAAEPSLNNLRAKMTLHYHSIEKGLTNQEVRLGFGKFALERLFEALDKFIELGFPTTDNRFQQSIAVLLAYVDFHHERGFPLEWVESKLKDYLAYFDKEFTDVGGYGERVMNEIPDYGNSNFEELALSRHSIRDFGDEMVEDESIQSSIQIATKTPSVCNRQASKVYRIKNKDLLEKVYRLQGGLVTQGENLQEILLVTSNREFMEGPNERNQTYIDGGMFLMSLVYALTYNQVASCVLNAVFDLEKEKKMRELLDISYSEDFIAFIAIGSFKNENKYAKSPRDNWNDITITIQ